LLLLRTIGSDGSKPDYTIGLVHDTMRTKTPLVIIEEKISTASSEKSTEQYAKYYTITGLPLKKKSWWQIT